MGMEGGGSVSLQAPSPLNARLTACLPGPDCLPSIAELPLPASPLSLPPQGVRLVAASIWPLIANNVTLLLICRDIYRFHLIPYTDTRPAILFSRCAGPSAQPGLHYAEGRTPAANAAC